MDHLIRPLAWALGTLAFGAVDLYAVGGSFEGSDFLLMGLGALPVAAFALFAVRSRNAMDN